jgi:hypothetical protein
MLTMRPWRIRWRMPVSDPMTSKCFWELEPDVEKGVGFLLYLRGGGPHPLGCDNHKHDGGAGRQCSAQVPAQLYSHHPPWSRGVNSVSSAVGSNPFRTSLNRMAAVKLAPVSSLKRPSASATASASTGSNRCFVSPV